MAFPSFSFALDSEGIFFVFTPTNDAFDTLLNNMGSNAISGEDNNFVVKFNLYDCKQLCKSIVWKS